MVLEFLSSLVIYFNFIHFMSTWSAQCENTMDSSPSLCAHVCLRCSNLVRVLICTSVCVVASFCSSQLCALFCLTQLPTWSSFTSFRGVKFIDISCFRASSGAFSTTTGMSASWWPMTCYIAVHRHHIVPARIYVCSVSELSRVFTPTSNVLLRSPTLGVTLSASSLHGAYLSHMKFLLLLARGFFFRTG